jgi:hypothetical protein
MTWVKGEPDEPGRYVARWPAVDQMPPGLSMVVNYIGQNLAVMENEYVIEASALEWNSLRLSDVTLDDEMVEACKLHGLGDNGG